MGHEQPTELAAGARAVRALAAVVVAGASALAIAAPAQATERVKPARRGYTHRRGSPAMEGAAGALFFIWGVSKLVVLMMRLTRYVPYPWSVLVGIGALALVGFVVWTYVTHRDRPDDDEPPRDDDIPRDNYGKTAL
jgi:hypothetical protein